LVRQSSHGDVIKGVREHLADIFEKSDQSIYIYLDDINKVCNERFASLLGYATPKEWAAVRQNFPEAFVSPKDRQRLVSAYQDAVDKLVGSTISISWKKKGGNEIYSTTILGPLTLSGNNMALHFISPS